MNTGKLKYNIIDPNSTSADGVFSFEGGQTNITFNIAQSETEFLHGDSVKLNFELVLKDGTDVVSAADEVRLSMATGIHGLVSQVDAHSYETNSAISSTRVYNRLCSTIIGNGMADQNDIASSQSHAGLGISNDYMNTNVGIYPTASIESSTAIKTDMKQSYCMRVLTGSLMGTKFYLGSVVNNGIGGIKLNFTLAPDSNALTTIATAGTGYKYELSNVKLVYITEVGTDEEIRANRLKADWSSKYSEMVRNTENRSVSREEIETNFAKVGDQAQNSPAVYSYRDFNGYLNTIASDSHNLSVNLGLKSVNSIFVNFLPSSYINSTTANYDGNRQYPILDTDQEIIPFNRITQTKGAELYPQKYTQTTNCDVNFTGTALDNTMDRRADVKKNYLDSVVPYSSNDYQRSAVYNSLYPQQYSLSVNTDTLAGLYGIGTGRLSVLDGNTDYQFSPYGAQIDSQNNNTFQNTTGYIFAQYDSQVSISNAVVSVAN
jgi:hypothetical protein